jgi:Tfp pilus tip-associated adhesin PilY1
MKRCLYSVQRDRGKTVDSNPAQHGDEWSLSRFIAFNPREKVAHFHFKERAGLQTALLNNNNDDNNNNNNLIYLWTASVV